MRGAVQENPFKTTKCAFLGLRVTELTSWGMASAPAVRSAPAVWAHDHFAQLVRDSCFPSSVSVLGIRPSVYSLFLHSHTGLRSFTTLFLN